MKTPSPDLIACRENPSKFKDKRGLVLFLLGVSLLSTDYWPVAIDKAPKEPSSYWVFIEDPAKFSFKIFSRSVFEPQDIFLAKTNLNHRQQAQLLPLAFDQPFSKELPAALALFLNKPLPINRADRRALEMLPGIGPHLAISILEELQQKGRFSDCEDVLDVAGIGPKKLQKLLPFITFE